QAYISRVLCIAPAFFIVRILQGSSFSYS
ncbi:hypothetical protein WI3_04789, partial [Escherichia coli KTE99]